VVQYFSNALGTSDHIQHGDLDVKMPPRRFPNLFLRGDFNKFGTEVGFSTKMKMDGDGLWSYNFLAEWPVELQVSEWGINPDGNPDNTGIYGDLDKDGVLDRLPPSALVPATISLNSTPPAPFLSWKLSINDGTLQYKAVPSGNRWHQLVVFILLWTICLLTGALGIWGYLQSYVHPDQH
jgi:alpha-1,3-glucan synthase